MRVARAVLTLLAALLLTAGTAIAAVPAGAERIIYVRTERLLVGPNQFAAQSANCPAGTKVTGGWVTGGRELHSSYPLNDGNSWRGAIRTGEFSTDFYVGAICVPGLTDYNIQTEVAPAWAGQTSFRIAFCNTGEVVGGGAAAVDLNVRLMQTMVFHNTGGGRSGWISSYRNNDAETRSVYTFAICANGVVNRAVRTSTEPTSLGIDISVYCPQPGTIPISGGGYGPGFVGTAPSRPDPQNPNNSRFTIWAGPPSQADRAASVICGS